MKQVDSVKVIILLGLLIFLARPIMPQHKTIKEKAFRDNIISLLDHKPGHQDNGNGNGNGNGNSDTTDPPPPPPPDTTDTTSPPPPPPTDTTTPPPPPPPTDTTTPPPPPPPTDTTTPPPPPPPTDTTTPPPPPPTDTTTPPPPPPPPTDTATPPPPPPPTDTTTPPPPPPTDTTTPPPPNTDPPKQPGVKATATISGIDSVCSGESGELSVKLTGSPPWDISVLYNGASFKKINNIRTTDYVLKVSQPGMYTLASVEDAFSRGKVSGSGEVRLRSKPTGTLSGTASFCGDGTATLNVSLTGQSPWKFTYQVSGTSFTVSNVTSSTGQINAGQSGTYKLIDVYDRYCEGTASGSAVVSQSEAPDVQITGLEDSYSQQFTEWIEINGAPSGGQFSGNGVLHHDNKWYFVPSIAKLGNNDIVYKYRQSASSCYGFDTVTVRIYESTADILFTRERTGFCSDEAPFQISGINKSGGGIGTFSISGGKGLADHANNTATIDPSVLSAGEYIITYKAADGTEVQRTIQIGESLRADFTWGTDCYTPGQPLHFTNTSESSFGTLGSNSFLWKIYGKNDTLTWTSEEISYNFSEPGTYSVSLQAVNSFGCTDTALKVLSLQPVVELAGQTYFEDFEDPTKWQSAHASSINSWELGSPEKHGFPVRGFSSAWSGQICWYTYITENPVPEEESWITSPCFDFTGTQKPTFIAKVWRSFADNHDGASLQYSTDNGKKWSPVGSINDGIQWFNSYYGPSGEQSVGWTSIKDTGWVEIRHALDFLADEPQVIFRIHYQATGEAFWNDGIAIDDITIAERNKNLIIEHFTNSSDYNSAVADSILYQVIQASGTNIIDLHYHTADPAGDPLNGDNPVIPSTRQLYYSINTVPYTLINGGMDESDRIDYISKSPNPNVLAVESLYDSDFKLNVYSITEGDSLNTQVVITATKDIPLTEIALRIVVLESLVDDVQGTNGTQYFRNVVKTMLPDAAGAAIYKEWTAGEMVVVSESWSLENIYDSSTIRVVAFLQDETTKEIYQAEMDRQELLTGNKDAPDLQELGFSIYPNPANERIYVNMEDPGNDRTIEVINYLGSTVFSEKVAAGESRHEIKLSAIPAGMYLIRISDSGQIRGTQKVIISR